MYPPFTTGRAFSFLIFCRFPIHPIQNLRQILQLINQGVYKSKVKVHLNTKTCPPRKAAVFVQVGTKRANCFARVRTRKAEACAAGTAEPGVVFVTRNELQKQVQNFETTWNFARNEAKYLVSRDRVLSMPNKKKPDPPWSSLLNNIAHSLHSL